MGLSPRQREFLEAWIVARCGNVMDETRRVLVEARLGSVVAELGFESLDALVDALALGRGTSLEVRVLEAVLNHETTFFRDLRPFDALRRDVLPALMRARASRRTLRIWSAACSFGQEPYSVAMTIATDHPSLLGWDLRILGTDLSDLALERARAGRYSKLEINRGLPARMLIRYFEQEGDSWRINQRMRSLVEYRRFNLVEPWPEGERCDVILLRNVLIYFDQASKLRVLEQAAGALASDGYLFLGGSETLISPSPNLVRVEVGGTWCFRPR